MGYFSSYMGGGSGGVSSRINTISATSGAIVLDAQATNVMDSVTGDCAFTFTNWPPIGIEARFRLRVNASTGSNVLSFAGLTDEITLADGEAITIDFSSIDGGETIQISYMSSLSGNSLKNHGTVTTAAINPAYQAHIVTAGASLALTAEGWPETDADGPDWCEVQVIGAAGKAFSLPAGSILPNGAAITITGTCNLKFEKLGSSALTVALIDEDIK